MEKLVRPVAIGVAIGGLLAALYLTATSLPNARADEGPLETVLQSVNDLNPSYRVDPDTLVRIGDEAWTVTADASVSLTPVSTSTVRKVVYGQVKVVTISTTSSGVYSSDAIVNPHIQYPGITVQRLLPDTGHFGEDKLAYWASGKGWVLTPSLAAGSFMLVAPFDGGVLLRSPKGTCVLSDGIAAC